MKTRISRPEGSHIELIVDNGQKGPRLVLASLTHVHGTGAWMMTDVRLHPHRTPSEYSGGLKGDDVASRYQPENKKEAAIVRSLLREYREEGGNIIWSTFAGLVKGTPRDHILLKDNNDVGYFTRAEGLAKLNEVQAWWEAYEGPLEAAKLPNPLLQPTEMMMYALVERAQRSAAGATAA
jgi:hypothetical protein